MAFVDELEIDARAGRGGDGVIRWLHLKGKEFSGPAGGNGGDGGDVYVRGVRDINLLSRYRNEKKFEAGDGGAGENRLRHGKCGTDLYIDLPIGSIVTNTMTGERSELLREGETILVLKGGRGGAGNAVFKSSVNRSPETAFPGATGESGHFLIELRLLADAGFIGLPNAGKTTLLNALTGAEAKIGNYPFTTLDPNVGVLYGFVLADIPGLIEGASEGKGLGHKFLRHIARTKILLHCISLESQDPRRDYEIVRKELSSWPGNLDEKVEVLIFTKSDSRDHAEIQRIIESFKQVREHTYIVSILDDAAIKTLKEGIVFQLQEGLV